LQTPPAPRRVPSFRQDYGLATILAAICSLLVPISVNASTSIEESIQHIRDGLLPPVLIEGEAPRKETLLDQMAHFHVPGVSIAVIRGGRIEWARGFGVAEIGGPPVTPRTLFQAASISKPVTALAALRLVQEGRLGMDADVNRYLKHWKIPNNRFTDQHPVTLRELLSHTAGMTVHGFAGYHADAVLPTLVQILDGQPPANSPPIIVDTLPGSRWRYSGGGYVVVQQLLEDVTGMPFDKLMQKTVLGPIGMSDSSYEQPLPKSKLATVAFPYRISGELVKGGGPHVYPERAPAGLWTTPSDLARYGIEVQRALAGHSHRVLTAATTRAMLTPGMNRQGIGPLIGGSASNRYFEHSGSNEGYRCDLLIYEHGDGVAIMTNSDNGDKLFPEILRTIAYEYHWPDFQPPMRSIAKIDPRVFDSLVGSYEIAPDFVLTFRRQGEQFIVQATGEGQGPLEVFPQSGQEYFAKAVDALVSFELNDKGQALAVTLHQNGHDMTARRLDDTAAKKIADTLAATNARFRTQVPAPGSEKAVRAMIDEYAAGAELGRVSQLIFEKVLPDGTDVYRVGFEKGSGTAGIALSADGTVRNSSFVPADY
jgi:CubicO group peptidase (beta-lactamase class C family)